MKNERDVTHQVDAVVMLFAWQPRGHGQYSFFVASHSEDEAKAAIEKYIAEHLNKDDDHWLSDYSIRGWGTNYYKLTILPIGRVTTNDNY